MVETVGKKLELARKRKQISIEEAARATRMRPDKILDLEKDNYTNFPNMTYAKGFLLIYAKFLNVEVSDFADTLATTNPVGIEDYEYLNASERRVPHAAHRAPRPALWPFFMVMAVVFGAICVMYFILTLKRIAAPDTSDIALLASPSPLPSASPQASVEVRRVSAVASPLAMAATPAPSAIPAPSAMPTVASTPEPTATPTPVPVLKDVALKPIKKTWVKVVKDVQDSPPIFEDYLYPDAHGLKFRGYKFWIDVREKDAVEITKDGAPVAIDGNSVTIE